MTLAKKLLEAKIWLTKESIRESGCTTVTNILIVRLNNLKSLNARAI